MVTARAGEDELDAIALLPALKLFTQWGFGRDNEDRLFVVSDFSPAGFWPDEVKGSFAIVVQFDQRADIDAFAVLEFAGIQLLESGDGRFEIGRLAGLSAREIGCFQPAGIILVLGFALFIGRLGMSRLGSAGINFEFTNEMSYDALDNSAFVH